VEPTARLSPSRSPSSSRLRQRHLLRPTSFNGLSWRADQPGPFNFVLAQCLADFDGDGETDVFLASGDGTQNPTPVDYFRSDAGTLEYDATFLPAPLPGLVHPRKCILGDFNRDGRVDLFVAAHGYDQPPFPGEAPLGLLNLPDGFTVIPGLDADAGAAGFNHGAAAGDVDEDGDLDLFVARNSGPFWLLNDGTGHFTLDTTRVPASIRAGAPLFTTEIIDVDRDGHLDLLVSGHEQDGLPAEIFWGDGSGTFTDDAVTPLPAIAGWGVTIDIDADDLTGDGLPEVVLDRTGDPTGVGFYQGYRLQLLQQGPKRVFTDVSDTNLASARSDTESWIVWIRLQDRDHDGDLDVHVEQLSRNLAWLNDGTGHFSP
jgi:hypothetical protein